MCGGMEFCDSFPFATFVALTVDQFVERGDGLLECRIATFFEKLAHFFRFVRKIGVMVFRKTWLSCFIFEIGTLNPHGINERFSFN